MTTRQRIGRIALAIIALGFAPTIRAQSNASVSIQPESGEVHFESRALGSIGHAQAIEAIDSEGGRFSPFEVNGTAVRFEAHPDGFMAVHLTRDEPGVLDWPVLQRGPDDQAWILPKFEGIRLPMVPHPWAKRFHELGPNWITEALSMPWAAVQNANASTMVLIDPPYQTKVGFERLVDSDDEGTPGSLQAVVFQHVWTPLTLGQTVTVYLKSTGPDDLAAAREYRNWLLAQERLPSLAEKLPAEAFDQLLGAPHLYLWGDTLLARGDVKRWPALARALLERPAYTSHFNADHRQALRELAGSEWGGVYLTRQVAEALTHQVRIEADARDVPRSQVKAELHEALSAHFKRTPDQWGGGISPRFLKQLKTDGLDRAMLLLSNAVGPATSRPDPELAQTAKDLGFLLGPYDSYHSMHPPQTPSASGQYPDGTWPTAQFDDALYQTARITKANGQTSPGFKKVGFHVSPLAVKPYVARRVDPIVAESPYSAWFVDCDAFGQLFENYSDNPAYRHSRAGDAEARLNRMDWLLQAHGLVVGSEGGHAYAVPAIHFAHGLMTPVVGWGDPDHKDPNSPHFMGKWWPPERPGVFFTPAVMKPKYVSLYLDPAIRLPLFQAVFKDAVVATHQWGYGSLKFGNTAKTIELLETLYSVAPLTHLDPERWAKRRETLGARYARFHEQHRRLFGHALTGFQPLTDDRLVQRVEYEDGTIIVANFMDEPWENIPAKTAVTTWPGEQGLNYEHDRDAAAVRNLGPASPNEPQSGG